ncbi:uncharacterized protein LOC113205679 isoform X4 [Frankliniella occidentalis]|uniref:Uncharacterized protein LOC113205679 isoform X4 n=1 Tax=Frankliniella occidentalis TaxID=133901 RepID=A0A9C6UCT4_FRAOC|nr:uncharacterized protein LOC113205679 isoform X4 [Frankliniella occidentalis]
MPGPDTTSNGTLGEQEVLAYPVAFFPFGSLPVDSRGYGAERCDLNVILLDRDDAKGIRAALGESLFRVYSRWPLSRFVLVLPRPAAPAAVDDVFLAVWTMTSHLNVVVLSRPLECAFCNDVHAYWPFYPRCNDSSARLVGRWRPDTGLRLWGHGLLGVHGVEQQRRSAFPLEAGPAGAWALRRLHHLGCPLRVGFMNFPGYLNYSTHGGGYNLWGVGASLLRACEQRLNFTAKLSLGPWPNQWNKGLKHQVREGAVDVALFPGAFNEWYLSQNVTVPVSYTVWCYTWAVPAAFGVQPALFWRLTAEFTPETWALVGASLIVAWYAAALLMEYEPAFDPNLDKSGRRVEIYRTAVALVTATLVGLPVHHKTRGAAGRVFLSSWVYVGIVLTTAYTAALHSLVAAPVGARPVKSVQELADSNIPVGGYVSPLEHMRNTATFIPAYAKLFRRAREIPEFYLDDYLANATMAVVDRRDWLVLLARAPSGRHRGLHVMQHHCMSTMNVFPFLLRRGSPLEASLRDTVLLLEEVGLLSHWRQQEEGDSNTMQEYDSQRRVKPFGISQMSPVFIAYAISIAAAVCVLNIEIYYGSYFTKVPS